MTTQNTQHDPSLAHVHQQSQEPSGQSSQPLPSDQQSWPAREEQFVQHPHWQGHRLHPFLLIALPALVVLVILAGLFGFLVVTRGMPGLGHGASTGPFHPSPSDAAQLTEPARPSLYAQYKQLARLYVSHMTLDEELGQLMMVEYPDASYSPDLDRMITQLHAGGVILYEFQMQTFNQTKHDIVEMQKHAFLPLLISTDEEGGPFVHRLANIDGLRMSAPQISQTGNPNVATQQGQQAAHDLLALGINENLAPDVDVNLVNSYDVASRTFGNTPQSVITFAGAYLKGLQGSGVIGCIKHFPGLGAAQSDAHTGLPVVKRTQAQLYSVELAPFKSFIQSTDRQENPGMIMPTDVLMPAIDPHYPAELSRVFMTDILRNAFGYDGVVLTDSLYMQGIAQTWTLPEAAVLALNAGDDMLLGPANADQMVAVLAALKTALHNKTLSKERIDEAATRIIALKMEYHLMLAVSPQF